MIASNLAARLTTSQFVTAPKPADATLEDVSGLTTSQFVTAPKLAQVCRRINKFDYQSVCHCSKTYTICDSDDKRLTTSQFVTAPKLRVVWINPTVSLTTSQFVTAPKQNAANFLSMYCLTTSQFVTAPKPKFVFFSFEPV